MKSYSTIIQMKSSRGLSLVELMISMTLGLILALGVVELFIANKATLRTQEGIAQIQETGRYAMYRIGKSIRGAGYFGCMGAEIVKPNVIAVIDTSDTNELDDDFTEISAETAIEALNDVSGTNDYDAQAGTDVLILRGAGDEGVGLVGAEVAMDDDIPVNNGFTDFEEEDLVLITDCAATDLLRATDDGVPIELALNCSSGGSCNTSSILSRPYTEDSYVLKPYAHAYYVKDSGRNNSSGADTYSLYMQDIDGNEEEIVEGVSDMQLLFGLDQANDDSAADIYMDATQVTNANAWADVVSVKVSLLVDSVENALDRATDYTFTGSSVTPSSTDKRLWKEFSGLLSLRNRTL